MGGTLARVVFMGTPEFAVPTLVALHEMCNIEVVGVYTSSDAASRRGTKRFPTPVKTVACKLGLPVRTPPTLRDGDEVAYLVSLEPTLVVVAAYGLILPRTVLDIPLHGCINIHASLLPRWRGAAPIQRALLKDDAHTGVSLMRMEEGLDTGAYCAQRMVSLDGADSFDKVSATLAQTGADLLTEHLADILVGDAQWTTQDETQATYAPKIDKTDMLLAPTLTARELYLRIRAANDRAPARMGVSDKDIRVCSARVVSPDACPAQVRSAFRNLAPAYLRATKDGLVVAGSNPTEELLVVSSVKPAGGREMSAQQWARGMRFIGDIVWG